MKMGKSVCTIGILGGGQLARMLVLAGLPLGLRFRIFDPAADACAGQVAPLHVGKYEDTNALAEFARSVDVITYEFENVPTATAQQVASIAPVFPPARALEVSQDRFAEKQFFQKLGIPITKCEEITSSSYDTIFSKLNQNLGFPIILKTRFQGYDGKGQFILKDELGLAEAKKFAEGRDVLAEAFVPFERELSCLGVRNKQGECHFYPLVENVHKKGILHTTLAPAPKIDEALRVQSETILRAILENLQYVGVLALEMFQVGTTLYANEMAPRVHNSGHWSIEGTQTSQFENHIRAVSELPLGSCENLGSFFMYNLVGIEPHREKILRLPQAKLHWYGKEVRPGRKVGHITVRLKSTEEAQTICSAIEQAL